MSRPKPASPHDSPRDARGHYCTIWGRVFVPAWWCHCEHHGCPKCPHWQHDEDGCGAPDHITGWCECDYEAAISDARQLLRNGRKP